MNVKARFDDRHYKWTALILCTVGTLMASIDGSILLISLPDIFRGIHINPLQPGNSFYLLWLMLGFLIVTSVLVVSLGRLGDVHGRVKMYNLGFLIFTIFSIALSITWWHGPPAAIWLIVMRLFQGVGCAMLVANSGAILTDAFPIEQRGMANGINQGAAFSGSFIGLILGGLLAPVSWRLVFIVSVPVGVVGTVWGYRSLRELSERHRARIDWWGNITFAVGLILVMIGITYGIEPYGGHDMGWTSPFVQTCLAVGVALVIAFAVIEMRTPEPMFRLQLFGIRAFTAGVVASFLAALARGGLMFTLIIWLQGIWLPLHGYSFDKTPLYAGLAMIPLTIGLFVGGPTSGFLTDRFGARPFATGGMIASAVCFFLIEQLPVNFSYPVFGVLLFFTGAAMASFGSPNRTGVMNSLPARDRGAGSGMNTTFQNSAQVLSIGLFFTLMIAGISSGLSASLQHGLAANGVPAAAADHVAHLSPVSTLFAAFLGYDPVRSLVSPDIFNHLTAAQQAALTDRGFFPHLISGPFQHGLHYAFALSIVMSLVAAAASWTRGGHRRPVEESAVAVEAVETAEVPA
ncbi:MAG TPA: MFS transporter [Mycobacteriales bacterium]|nr:MFS transporter [Mycobacteriales bacterium]